MENKILELKDLEKEVECVITFLKTQVKYGRCKCFATSLSDCKDMNIGMSGKISYLLAMYKEYLKEND